MKFLMKLGSILEILDRSSENVRLCDHFYYDLRKYGISHLYYIYCAEIMHRIESDNTCRITAKGLEIVNDIMKACAHV